MIKFLKNKGRKLSNGSSESQCTNHNDLENTRSLDDEQVLSEAEIFCIENREIIESRTRLTRNLLEILAEQSCICYFVQFLESKDALPLIKFWLDVESFKAAAENCVKKNSLSLSTGASETNLSAKNASRKRILNRSVSSEGYDSLSYYSVDCDSISTNSFSEANLVEEEHSSNCLEIEEHSANCLEIECKIFGENYSTENEKAKIKDEIKDAKFNPLINSDAVRIYRKYLVTTSLYHIEIPATILSNVSLTLCGGNCNESIFDDAQQFVLEILENNYLLSFLDSTFYCKYTIDVLTSDNLSINDILYSETALFYFMEYLEQEHKRLYLEFWMSATNFKKTFDEKQAQSDALILYEKYFSLQATNPLSMSDKIRFSVEEQICSDENDDIINTFDLPIRIIERFLEQQYFKKFLKSQLFCKYLAEMFNKIQENGKKINMSNEKTTKSRHRKTYSDVTNDKSVAKFISSQNTLLAQDTSYRSRKGRKNNEDIMHINLYETLYNPDLLWKRDISHGLTFGRINGLGRYERDFDSLDDEERWSKSRLRKAMRKLVNLPEDKAQEELAWQVAEMIVKDVMTLNEFGNQEMEQIDEKNS